MQYLSKAYNYYSGINPATLSGAIDVIVVRHLDDQGNEVLSSSPFHVRFGKLQVLRAGEKRVTVRLPNNLVPPHIAPFSMKVGETGEAFFVLETDEEVPQDLLTSPVVMPSDASDIPPSLPPTDEGFPHTSPPHRQGPSQPPFSGIASTPRLSVAGSLTQQPFGETEEQMLHGQSEAAATYPNSTDVAQRLGDVDFLDLDAAASIQQLQNEQSESPGQSSMETPSQTRGGPVSDTRPPVPSVSPGSLLNSATAMLPTIPFLSSSPPSSKLASPKKGGIHPALAFTEASEDERRGIPHQQVVPNPMVAQPGESTDFPGRDETISSYSRAQGTIHDEAFSPDRSDKLPKVKAGEGEGPNVIYGKDVVLDMAGYHSADRDRDQSAAFDAGLDDKHIDVASTQTEERGIPSDPQSIQNSLVEMFAHDLISSMHPPTSSLVLPSRPILPPARVTDPAMPRRAMLSSDAEHVATSTKEASSRLDASSVDSAELGSPTKKHAPSSTGRRYDRGKSEPPHDPDDGMFSADPSPSRHQVLDTTPSSLSFSSDNEMLHSYSDIHMPSSSGGSPNDAWDWGRKHQTVRDEVKKRGSEMERSTSVPPAPSGHTPQQPLRADIMPPPGLASNSMTPDHSKGDSFPGKLKNIEDSPFMFILDMEGGRSHTFELALCGYEGFSPNGEASDDEETIFLKNRISFQKFVEDPQVVDDPRLVVQYSLLYLTWTTCHRLLYALAMYRRSLTPPSIPSLPPLADIGVDSTVPPRPPSGYGWSRWWRRGQGGSVPPPPPSSSDRRKSMTGLPYIDDEEKESQTNLSSGLILPPSEKATVPEKQYAKTLRLSSDQLKQLNLKLGPNTVQFSVTSSYSGVATCAARIFLWDETDQIVISDIDGTISKSDALGHVFAAIGRDWTHGGIAKLYTDICNNGYKIMYLTSRAIGQADSTREYLTSIVQGHYRLPEGPVVMSPDRLMASLHREVIMRKPELFKMACLRDIQRLFAGQAKEAFYAGFGNRITDAMSYRSVGILTSKIYTIDSTGVVQTELLQSAGHKGTYMALNDLVNEVFPPVTTKVKPEFTDFNYWRSSIIDVPLPDLMPPSPTLSARSDASSRLGSSVLGKIASIGRRTSKQPLLPTTDDHSSRPNSPLIGPSLTSDELSEADEDEDMGRRSRDSSMPGSFDEKGGYFPPSTAGWRYQRGEEIGVEGGRRVQGSDEDGGQEVDEGDAFEEGANFDDDIFATGEMRNVPF